MTPEKDYFKNQSNYDPFAFIYNDYNANIIYQRSWPVLEKLLLPSLPAKAHILDLCCGTGQMTQQLYQKGYRVTGIDNSEGMLRYARQNAPQVNFFLQDARSFEINSMFDSVISLSDSLNHIMDINEVKKVFQNVYSKLFQDRFFLFDLNLEERYLDRWNNSLNGDVKDTYAWAARRNYDPNHKMGRQDITIFQLMEQNQWTRTDTTILEKCFSKDEIQSALASVGFSNIKVFDAKLDLRIESWGPGKAYFLCLKESP